MHAACITTVMGAQGTGGLESLEEVSWRYEVACLEAEVVEDRSKQNEGFLV